MEREVLARTLSRYSERFDQPEVDVKDDGQVRVRLGHEREGAGGRAFLVVKATVGPEGMARLQVPEGAWVEGTLDAEEARSLATAGERMVNVLAGLCHCALPPDDCDCCPHCDAEGLLESGTPCAACAGLGYDALDADAEAL